MLVVFQEDRVLRDLVLRVRLEKAVCVEEVGSGVQEGSNPGLLERLLLGRDVVDHQLVQGAEQGHDVLGFGQNLLAYELVGSPKLSAQAIEGVNSLPLILPALDALFVNGLLLAYNVLEVCLALLIPLQSFLFVVDELDVRQGLLVGLEGVVEGFLELYVPFMTLE